MNTITFKVNDVKTVITYKNDKKMYVDYYIKNKLVEDWETVDNTTGVYIVELLHYIASRNNLTLWSY